MALQMSLRARAQVEERFAFDATYCYLAQELLALAEQGITNRTRLNECLQQSGCGSH
jgi:hypothetical protein